MGYSEWLTNNPPMREVTFGVSSATSARAGEGTPMRLLATVPPIKVVAVFANASLRETEASFETENAEALNGIRAATVKAERRTIVAK
jgi:hypothetical protein